MKRPKWGFVVGGAAFLAMIVPIMALALTHHVPELLTNVILCAFFGVLGLRYGFTSLRGARFSSATLTVDKDQALHADGRLLARRSELRQGFVFLSEEGVLVRLERLGNRPPIVLRVDDEAEGELLIRALGFGADHVSAFMSIASRISAMPTNKQAAWFALPVIPLMLGIFGLGTAMPGEGNVVGAIAMCGVVGYVAYALALALLPTQVSIGTDGILSRWAGKERFIPFADIRSAKVYQEYIGAKYRNGVALALANGDEVKLATGQTDVGAADAMRLAHRIQEAQRARSRGASAPAGGTLMRGGRSILEWVRELRRIGAGVVDHRTAVVPVEKLLQIVEDTAAPAAHRAAAALAAASSADAQAKWRVHVAAETTVSPQLRVALLRIADAPADAPDEELAPCLEEIGSESESEKRSA